MNKKQITILIISVSLILIACILYTLEIRTMAVAELGAKAVNNGIITIEDIKSSDSIFPCKIITDLGIFSIIQIFGLAMYLLKKKKGLIAAIILEIVFIVLNIVGFNNPSSLITTSTCFYIAPLINMILYFLTLDTKKR